MVRRSYAANAGGYYGQKIWHSNDAYRRIVWRCNRKYDNAVKCSTPTITEEEIKAMFVMAFNQLMGKRSSAVRDCEDLATMLENTPVLDRRIEEAQKETDLYAEQNRALIRERAATGMSDEEYDKRVVVVKQHYTAAEARLAKLMAEKASRQARSKEIRRFLEKLKGQPTVREGWDEQAWNLLVSQVTIQSDGSAEFIFKGEIKITVRA